MSKVTLTIIETRKLVSEVDLSCYPVGTTIDEIKAMELEAFKEHYDYMDEATTESVVIEVK